MFRWLFGKEVRKLESKTERGFNSVKHDMDKVGKWLKHLDTIDKQLFDVMDEIKKEISSIKDELGSLREGVDLAVDVARSKQVFEKTAVWGKQTAVEDVYNSVQTAVQTGNFYEILQSLSANERLLILTLANNEMKLSYEDLALLLGKERATIRGQINAIKQKSAGLIEEIIEKNGKKRVFVPEEIKQKLSKYAKVRVKSKQRQNKDSVNEENYAEK